MVSVVPAVNMTALCSQFLQTAASDNAHGGYCARGVANILEDIGFEHIWANAHSWEESLPQQGWQLLEGITPENAPPGAVLVYDHNESNYSGKGGGAEFGHVEIVAVDANGDRKYVSDAARNNWGGTVPGNFVGVYIHPKLHQPLESGSYSTTLLASNTPSTDSPSNGSDTPQVFQDAERQRRDINDLVLRNAQLGTDQPNTTQNFNDAANATPFMLLAAILEVVFGVKMDLAPATDASTTEQITLVAATPDTFTAASTKNTANTVTTIGI